MVDTLGIPLGQPGRTHIDPIKGSLILFLIVFFSVGVVVAGSITFIYQLQTENHIDRLKGHEKMAVEAETRIIKSVFNGVTADLQYLSQQRALHSFLEIADYEYLEIVEQEYLNFARAKRNYDQIRFLNHEGMEIVRVNYNQGNPQVTPRPKLQNKAGRYYFSDTFALKRNQIFVSPLDLNIEHGQVERPLKPMIRFGMVVFDGLGRKKGVILLNFLGDWLLNMLMEAGQAMYGQPLLINRDGYWILGPRPDDAWGFMLPERKDKTLTKRFSLSAEYIAKKETGQLLNREGMFSFTSIYPLKEGQISSSGAGTAFAESAEKLAGDEYRWKLVSYISRDNLAKYSHGLLFNLALLGAGLFLLSGVASWLIASSITRKKIHRIELFNLAHYDTLTGLPNRTLFFDRLQQVYEASKRHDRQFAILYIDLDDFKQINDTLGHSAGDNLLIQVAQRMLRVVRKTDTVGRMGGDEFMIVLNEISEYRDAEMVAQKLLDVVSKDYFLGQDKATIGACVGVSVFPTDSDNIDSLTRQADRAMYASKSAGKNLVKTDSALKESNQV